MISAKSVRPCDSTPTSELLTGNTNGEVIRYSNAASGSTVTPRSSMKAHHKARANSAMGGTNNMARAMFGYEPCGECKRCANREPCSKAKLCKVVTRELDSHVWMRGEMVRTNTKPVVTSTVIVTPGFIPTSTLIMRAERRDMGVLAYCSFISYLPTEEQANELLSLD